MPSLRRAVAAALAALAFLVTNSSAASASTTTNWSQRGGPRPSYVALGDSYAAGLGAAPATDACGRSALAYPRLIARATGWQLTQAACSGATMADVAATQLALVTASTDYVTVQVGGNEAGFVPVLSVCAQVDSDAACAAANGQSQAFLSRGFGPAVTQLFAVVRAQAPRARLVVVGYPRLFGGKNCSPLVEFTATERALLNDTVDLLNSRLAAAADAVGARFANPTWAFGGHAWCSKLPFVNGSADPVVASFHPNALGQALGYLPVVGRQLF